MSFGFLGGLAYCAQADALPPQGRAQRFGIDADDLRDLARPERRQCRDDFRKLARCPAPVPARASGGRNRGMTWR
jgi:hypothetical protein